MDLTEGLAHVAGETGGLLDLRWEVEVFRETKTYMRNIVQTDFFV